MVKIVNSTANVPHEIIRNYNARITHSRPRDVFNYYFPYEYVDEVEFILENGPRKVKVHRHVGPVNGFNKTYVRLVLEVL